MDSQAELEEVRVALADAFHFLLANGYGAGNLEPRICKGLVDVIGKSRLFSSLGIHFSVETFNSAGSSWTILAATHPMAQVGVEFPYDQGLTGWMLRTKRRILHEASRSNLPQGFKPTPGYEGTESAFLYTLRIDGRQVGCICAASDKPHAISNQLATALYQLGHMIDLLLSRDMTTPRLPQSRLTQPVAHPAVDSLAMDYVAQRLPSHYSWVNFWRWDAQGETLHPTQVSKSLLAAGDEWLRPLRLDEGFVGHCAAQLREIVEHRIENSRGSETGIETPLAQIQPGLALHSILVSPVYDQFQFYGVLAILGETFNYFNEDDVADIRAISEDLATVFSSREERAIVDLHKEIRQTLDDTLYESIEPKVLWLRLNDIYRMLVQHSLCNSSSFWVRRRDDPNVYSLKSGFGISSEQQVQKVDPRTNKIFHALLGGNGRRGLQKLPWTLSDSAIIPSGTETIWSETYFFDPAKKEHPTFLALLNLPPKSRYTAPWGLRPRDDFFSQVSGSIFGTARAILMASDARRLTHHRAVMMASETHDLKQPLSTIKHAAEVICKCVSEGKNEGQIEKEAICILEKVDDSFLKLENMIYHDWLMKDSESTLDSTWQKTPLDIVALVEQVVSDAKNRYSTDTILLCNDLPKNMKRHSVNGSERWLAVAIRNVLDNAIKFGQQKPVEVRLKHAEGKEYRIEIADRGIGIPPSFHKAIFEPGRQIPHSRKRNVTGSQIGLSVSRHILVEHGGSIWLSSEPGKGSTFFIKLLPHIEEPAR